MEEDRVGNDETNEVSEGQGRATTSDNNSSIDNNDGVGEEGENISLPPPPENEGVADGIQDDNSVNNNGNGNDNSGSSSGSGNDNPNENREAEGDNIDTVSKNNEENNGGNDDVTVEVGNAGPSSSDENDGGIRENETNVNEKDEISEGKNFDSNIASDNEVEDEREGERDGLDVASRSDEVIVVDDSQNEKIGDMIEKEGTNDQTNENNKETNPIDDRGENERIVNNARSDNDEMDVDVGVEESISLHSQEQPPAVAVEGGGGSRVSSSSSESSASAASVSSPVPVHAHVPGTPLRSPLSNRTFETPNPTSIPSTPQVLHATPQVQVLQATPQVGVGVSLTPLSSVVAGDGSVASSRPYSLARRTLVQKEQRRNPIAAPPPPVPVVQDEEEEEEEVDKAVVQEEAVVWGTDVHVPTASEAFMDFWKHFVSLEECERRRRRLRRKRVRREMEVLGLDDDDSDDDDTNDGPSVSSASTKPYYPQKLRDLIRPPGGLDRYASSGEKTPKIRRISLDLDCRHLYYHSDACRRLYRQLLEYPQEIVPLMDLLVGRQVTVEASAADDGDEEEENRPKYDDVVVQVRPFHLRTLSNLRGLDPLHVDTLVGTVGMVVRTSPVVPDLKVAAFVCAVCGHLVETTIDRGRVTEPTGRCPTCQADDSFQLRHNRCTYADKQFVRLQETPDAVPAGETPASMSLFVYDDLVDAVRPGDRVEATGVYRAMARRVHPRLSKVGSVYRTYMDIIHFRKVSSTSMSGEGGTAANDHNKTTQPTRGHGLGAGGAGDDDDTNHLSEERIHYLEELSRDPDIYDKLAQSLAPGIWGMDDVKKGVLCMLFGGNCQRIPNGTDDDDDDDDDGENDEASRAGLQSGAPSSSTMVAPTPKLQRPRKRGDVHILLCGDPGTSKSQLLGYVHGLCRRGVYASGKGSSAVGLTASVVRDTETGAPVLESGALVLSDRGICCIDEFDKMSDATRAILHEAMEQQTVSVAKAGIVATLNARTSILASANPVGSRYDPNLSVVSNLRLPPTLLSRFDLVYLILDRPDADADRRLASHLVGLYHDDDDDDDESRTDEQDGNNGIDQPTYRQRPKRQRRRKKGPPLDRPTLMDYIARARATVHPKLSDLATQELLQSYLNLRSGGGDVDHNNNGRRNISATPRQLESLIRLSEALAKMRYSAVVDRKDVVEAVRLMKVATQAAATDPTTGRIDMDLLVATGRTAADRRAADVLESTVRDLLLESTSRTQRPSMSVSDLRGRLTDRLRQTTDASNTGARTENAAVVVHQKELMDCLRPLAEAGTIALDERAGTVVVRRASSLVVGDGTTPSASDDLDGF